MREDFRLRLDRAVVVEMHGTTPGPTACSHFEVPSRTFGGVVLANARRREAIRSHEK